VEEVVGQVFHRNFSGRDMERGRNFLIVEQVVRTLKHFLKAEREIFTNENIELLDVELQLDHRINILLPDTGQEHEVKLVGKIDRVDRKGESLRIMDYKTGKVTASSIKVGDIQDLDGRKLTRAFQLLFYDLLYHAKGAEGAPVLYLLSLRDSEKGLVALEMSGQRNIGEEQRRVFRGYLESLIAGLFDSSSCFGQTEDVNTCRACDFRAFCNRGSENNGGG